MNKDGWEAVERSATFGTELHGQFGNRLKAAVHAALSAEGVTIENLRATNDSLAADEAERTRMRQEEAEAERKDRIENSLFLTAAVGLLPSVQQNHDESLFLIADNEDQAYDILDTIIWFRKQPYWLAGYEYGNNTALLVSAAPPKQFYEEQLNNLLSQRRVDWSFYARFFKPYVKELSYHADARPLFRLLENSKEYEIAFSRIPENLRCAINLNESYVLRPGWKDRKSLKRFARNEARLDTKQYVLQTYDHQKRAFVITADSPQALRLRSDDTSLYPVGGETNVSSAISTVALNQFKVFENLIPLIARFKQEDQYLQLIRDAKDGLIEQTIMKQQGIPTVHGTEAVKKYLFEKAVAEGWTPKTSAWGGLFRSQVTDQ